MVVAADITKELTIPEGVTLTISGMNLTVKGPKGELKREFKTANGISLTKKGTNTLILSCDFPRKKEKAMLGTIEAHINNMMKGVTDGFEYHMQIYYSHFPMNVSVQGNKVIIKNFLGEKYPRESKIVGDTKVSVKGQDLTLSGINREDVGQTMANLKLASKIGRKDPRVFLDGIFLVDKGDKK